jgi:stress response protein SCP2
MSDSFYLARFVLLWCLSFLFCWRPYFLLKRTILTHFHFIFINIFFQGNIYVDFVYFNNSTCPGVTHSGDNRTGAGDGDDESIHFDLGSIDASVLSMVVVISCFTGDFRTVQEAFVRVENETTHQELGNYTLSGLFDKTSLIVCKFVRRPNGRPQDWIMQILGEQINGRSIIDFFHQDTSGPMADLRQEFKRKARSVYDDNRFFQECSARAKQGYAVASTEKDD